MTDEKVFESLEAVRAHYYPESAPLLDIERTELLEFPKILSEDSLRMIRRIAEAATKDLGSSAGGERTSQEEGVATDLEGKSDRRHVRSLAGGQGWVVTAGKETTSRHRKQANAIRSAERQLASTGGQVVLHRKDGRIRWTRRISPRA